MKTVFKLTLPALLLAALPAMAQTTSAASTDPFTQSPAYKECTSLAIVNPTAAEAKAAEWLKIDVNGVGAHHCRAMALYGQRRFAEAADELALVHNLIAAENINLRCFVTRQEAKAWLDAGKPDAAMNTIGRQITELGNTHGDNVTEAKLTADLLLERATMRATYGQYQDAVQDLDHAVSLSPTNEDVLLARANAFEQLNDIALAKNDIAVVLRLNPKNAKALEASKRLAQKSTTLKPL